MGKQLRSITIGYMAHNRGKEDKHKQNPKTTHKLLRDNCVSTQKAYSIQQKQLTCPDAAFLQLCAFLLQCLLLVCLVNNMIIRQGNEMNS